MLLAFWSLGGGIAASGIGIRPGREIHRSGAQASRPAPAGSARRRPRRRTAAGPPPPARRRRGRSRRTAGRAGLELVAQARRGWAPPPPRARLRAVFVVQPPPPIRRGLRIALGRVLPLLLAAKRGDVQVVPGAPHLFIAAAGDEVGAEDAIAVANEGARAVPLVDTEVGVEVVGDRVPGDVLPPHPRLVALKVRLRRARDERQRGVAGVQMGRVGDLVGHHRAARAATLWPVDHAGLEEEAVDDELAAPLEQLDQAHRPVRSVEAVLLLHRKPRHPPALGGQRITGVGEPLLLYQQLLAGGLPFLRRNDPGCVHLGSSRCCRSGGRNRPPTKQIRREPEIHPAPARRPPRPSPSRHLKTERSARRCWFARFAGGNGPDFTLAFRAERKWLESTSRLVLDRG